MLEGRSEGRVAAAAVVLAVVTGFLIWIVRGRSARIAATRSTSSKGQEPLDAVPAASADPACPGPARERDAGGASDTDSSDEDSTASEDYEGKVFPIDGRVVLTDSKDKERLDANGELVLYLDDNHELPSEHVAFEGGRFHLDVPGGHAFGIFSLEVDGRPAELQTSEEEYLWWHSKSPLTLHVRVGRPFLVHFIDATSNAELTDVTVFHDVNNGPPAHSDVVVSGGVSPVEFDVRPDPVEVIWHPDLRATVPGYADAEFEVNFRLGGQSFVPMHRAAALRVTVVGAPADAMVAVLRPEEIDDELRAHFESVGVDYFGMPVNSAPATSPEPVEIEDVPVGRYVVAVTVGNHLESVALAHQEVELVAGKTTELTLLCRKIEHAPPVPVAGTVEVPREWGDTPFELWFSPTRRPDLWDSNRHCIKSSEMQCDDGDPKVFHWSGVAVEPAEYDFLVSELNGFQRCTVGVGGKRDLRIAVGACGDVVLHVVDAATGSAIDNYSVQWETDATPFATDHYLRRDDEPKAYTGRVPVGRGTLRELGEFELIESDPIEIHPGKNELTLHVRRLPGVVLEFAYDGWRVPWTNDSSLEATPVDHEGEFLRESTDDAENVVLLVSRPGKYRVTIPAVAGFEIVPPFDVDVADGVYAHRTIELQRKR